MTIIDNQNLCKLLYYNSNTPLLEGDITNTHSLIMNNIYPFPIVPDIEEDAKNIITIILDDFRSSNSEYKTSKIVFNILCHIDLWSISGGLRPLSILNEIDRLFNQQRIATIGKLDFVSTRWITANKNWQGYQVAYKVTEFN